MRIRIIAIAKTISETSRTIGVRGVRQDQQGAWAEVDRRRIAGRSDAGRDAS